jgi:hypothetical protein
LSGKPDPRKPRKNPELRDIERVIRSNYRDFSAEKDHTRKRGYGMILQAALEQWLDEPEHLMDLMEGAAPVPESKGKDAAVIPGAEGLFDVVGEASDTFFYLGYGGGVTTVFHGRDADPFHPWDLSGYWVLLMEKLYVTEAETTNHFSSEVALRRHVGRQPTEYWKKDAFLVLCDPRGYYDGRTAMVAAKYVSEGRARKKALAAAEAFGIRFAVARNLGMITTH